MASTTSLRFLRSCTASLSSASRARTATSSAKRLLAASSSKRYYSETATEPPQGKAPEGDAVPPTPGSELVDKLKAKEAEVVDLTGRLRYLQADFLNLQRNTAREKEQTRDFAITRFAGDLLETVDVLRMALKSIPSTALEPPSSDTPPPTNSSPSTKSAFAYLTELHQGVEMTHRQLLQTLFKYHVKPFDPTGDVFDPNRHEALFQAPIPGKTPGTVFDCQKEGFMIKDRVLRAAQVGVVQDTS